MPLDASSAGTHRATEPGAFLPEPLLSSHQRGPCPEWGQGSDTPAPQLSNRPPAAHSTQATPRPVSPRPHAPTCTGIPTHAEAPPWLIPKRTHRNRVRERPQGATRGQPPTPGTWESASLETDCLCDTGEVLVPEHGQDRPGQPTTTRADPAAHTLSCLHHPSPNSSQPGPQDGRRLPSPSPPASPQSSLWPPCSQHTGCRAGLARQTSFRVPNSKARLSGDACRGLTGPDVRLSAPPLLRDPGAEGQSLR